MKQIFVKDIKPGNSISNTPFVVVKAEKKVAKNGKEYLDVTLGDSTGTILCKVWSEKYEACAADALKEGVVVAVTGSANEFMGKTQMVLSMAIPTTEYAEEDFVPVSRKNIDELLAYLHNQIDSIGDKHLKKLLDNVFSDKEFVKIFKKTPAAMRHHHAFSGGLLEHITEMLKFSLPMIEAYQPCNKDLIIAGIILHDIGKVEEIVWKNMSIEYSDKGKLLGHIQIGLQIIERYKQPDFDSECFQLLQHIILSHHGKIEFGAAVVPATIEAKIVSLADDASAKLRGYLTAFEDGFGNGASFSDYSRALETAVYLKSYASQTHSVLEEKNSTVDQPSLLDFNS
jgi:3'-5' exoribonuclease